MVNGEWSMMNGVQIFKSAHFQMNYRIPHIIASPHSSKVPLYRAHHQQFYISLS